MNETGTSENAARNAILHSIRESLAASTPFDAEHQTHHRPPIMPTERMTRAVDREALIENFRAGLTFVGATYSVVSGVMEAAVEVDTFLDGRSISRIAVSDSSLVDDVLSRLPGRAVSKNTPSADLFDCDLGITSAQWGIAETGTLVLESEREQHRLTSLVPPVHLCLLRASEIRQTLGEILQLLSRDLSRTVTFITGASRTSDIELTLAVGVHGPKELHVIVIRDH